MSRRSLTTWNGSTVAVALVEVLLIFLIFFLHAGWPAPDVNESHYLAKAKNFWDPGWCQGDFFLESSDAHLAFYWTFGWISGLVSLPAAAWVGRIATWGLLATAWRSLSFAVVPLRGYAVLSAGLLVCLWSRFFMAGEWVVGGVEAKGLAYVFVFFGLSAIVRNQWRLAWLLVGAAAAMHVLVGGWSAIAAAIAWLLLGRANRPTLSSMLPALLGALVLSLAGLVPTLSLNWSTDPALVREANHIYVFRRLTHHLVFHRFPPIFIARHVGLLVAWITLSGWSLRASHPYRRLAAFVAGAVLVAAAGTLVDFATWSSPSLAAPLLRFYWFRLSDAMLPVGVACALGVLLEKWRPSRPAAVQWATVVALCVAVMSMAQHITVRRADYRPGADIQGDLAEWIEERDVDQVQSDWRDVCQWISVATPSDATFLTPPRQQTFKWYAGRGELVNWKDIPQDAVGICQWWQRYQRVLALQRQPATGLDRRDRLFALAAEYGCSYIVAAHDAARTWNPAPVYANRSFAVFRLKSALRATQNAVPTASP